MMRRLVAVVAVLLLLAGCAGSPSGAPGNTAPVTSAPAPSEQQLQAARKQAGIRDCPASGNQPARADGLPDLTFGCLGSDRRVRLAGLRGHPMVINIWAQWCRPCRLEAPHLAAVARTAQAKGTVEFLGIDYGDPDPAAAIAFARQAGWHYPHLRDPDQQLKGPLKIIGVPQTFLVNAEGKIVYRQVKPLTSDAQLRALIHDHLGVTL